MLTDYHTRVHGVSAVAPRAAFRIAAHRRLHQAAVGILAVGVFTAACSDSPVERTSRLTPAQAKLHAEVSGATCGASATVVSNEQDSLMTQYGFDARADTLRLCETWTGSDYTTTVTTLGSSDDSLTASGGIRTTSYANGAMTGYDQSGNVVSETSAAGGSSLFDVVLADAAQRQASYDDPYYGLASREGCVSKPGAPPCPLSAVAAPTNGAAAGSTSGVSAGEAPRFTKHGLRRRGVRALVDAGDEIGPSPEGYRRFLISRPGLLAGVGQDGASPQRVIVSVDPKTELIMAEEATTAEGTTKARHTWKPTSWGYVRDQTVIDGEERLDGRRVTSHVVLTYLDVRINAPADTSARSGF